MTDEVGRAVREAILREAERFARMAEERTGASWRVVDRSTPDRPDVALATNDPSATLPEDLKAEKAETMRDVIKRAAEQGTRDFLARAFRQR